MERNKILKNKMSQFKIGDVEVGKEFLIIGGPCSIESLEMAEKSLKSVLSSGANIFRGGSYKPRTSPYSFQGLREEALEIMKELKERYNIPVVTEILDPRLLENALEYVDIGA